jgi:diaminopimelate epimerase
VVKGVELGYLQKEVTVNFKTGSLSIKYDSDNQVLTATGPADFLEETSILI